MLLRKCCIRCNATKPIRLFCVSKQYDDGYKNICKRCYNIENRKRYDDNREQEVARNRAKYIKLRQDVFSKYGIKCSCCGESELDFLTIDHMNISRKEHKKQTGGNAGGVYLYYWLKRNNYPIGFQTLCMNCNMSKYKNNGHCIHKVGKL